MCASIFATQGPLAPAGFSDNQEELKSYIGHLAAVYCCAFNHNGTLIASASRDKTLKIWDVENNHVPALSCGCVRHLAVLGAPVCVHAFTPCVPKRCCRLWWGMAVPSWVWRSIPTSISTFESVVAAFPSACCLSQEVPASYFCIH